MKTLLKDIEAQLEQARAEISSAQSENELRQIKSAYLGAKSTITQGFVALAKAQKQDRAALGSQLNVAKNQIESLLDSKLSDLVEGETFRPLDLSQPAIVPASKYGHPHPTAEVLAQTYQIFTELGFAIVDSPDIESDWYNFEALNMPESHPARDMQDTFYIEKSGKDNIMPRTHTSGMQVRFMENNKPPYKIIVPGRVFRNEDEDITHIWSFYQIEGLVVGEGVSMADLKGTLLRVVRGLLGHDVDIRFRASFFPYTEPSVELDCRYRGKWLELGGAGMVHPDVLRRGGVDPELYSGFAFGWGAERIANIKYGLTDLRDLWRPRFRYLEQF